MLDCCYLNFNSKITGSIRSQSGEITCLQKDTLPAKICPTSFLYVDDIIYPKMLSSIKCLITQPEKSFYPNLNKLYRQGYLT